MKLALLPAPETRSDKSIPDLLRLLADAEDASTAIRSEIQKRLSESGLPSLSKDDSWILADEMCGRLGVARPQWAPSLIEPHDILAMALECDQSTALRLLSEARSAAGPGDGNASAFDNLYGAVLTSLALDARIDRIAEPAKESESSVSDRLAVAVQGKREVRVPTGRIDVLSATQIIEVKAARKWRGAIGQVLDYAQFYPKLEKRIHLFDARGGFDFSTIMAACSAVGVIVTWEITADGEA